ncbi:IS110 family transposase, partial [Peribacillus simplex]
MNFKMQNKQNQLIERITDQHLVVGVDIAQHLHVAKLIGSCNSLINAFSNT